MTFDQLMTLPNGTLLRNYNDEEPTWYIIQSHSFLDDEENEPDITLTRMFPYPDTIILTEDNWEDNDEGYHT